jgi:hypothetical protein
VKRPWVDQCNSKIQDDMGGGGLYSQRAGWSVVGDNSLILNEHEIGKVKLILRALDELGEDNPLVKKMNEIQIQDRLENKNGK